MILAVDEVIDLPEFSRMTVEELEAKLKAAELAIRAYTNNNFQNRFVRFWAEIIQRRLTATHPTAVLDYLRVGDTVQVSQSGVNDGLYVIEKIGDGFLEVTDELFPADHNLVTKVEYPADVQSGVLNLLKWEVENRDKVGIKSETISRHSVTYYDQDASNTVMGYPVSLLGFLAPYRKARF